MSKINYVLVKDEDFIKGYSNSFAYIGNEPYIEIPHVIQGVQITSYKHMFRECSFIRGVKSTNKNIIDTEQMFCRCKNRSKTLNLSELDMTGVEYANGMFSSVSTKEIIWPKDKMPIRLQTMQRMFFNLATTTLDLSDFDFSHIVASASAFVELKADQLIYPTKGLRQLLDPYDPIRREPLGEIKTKFHTEELCWAAVLNNKKQGRYVKIKSKRILMYLGTDCPEYIKFYYDEEN